ncbi:kinase-like protein [Xylariaceae sp. FL0662B]|nr:kinase-like protein [Xylariaceae sp. FL0662B]
MPLFDLPPPGTISRRSITKLLPPGVKSPPLGTPRPDDPPSIISRQAGSLVYIFDEDGVICKKGDRVTRNEERALRLVRSHTDVPVPELYHAEYHLIDNVEHGALFMEHIEGSRLDRIWDKLKDDTKTRMCRDIWNIVGKLRQIPKPPELTHLYQCGTDGSASKDVLLTANTFRSSTFSDDESLRHVINECYLHCNGGSYREHLPDFLPHSSTSVFTHGDLTPRNILIGKSETIAGIVDWENAGWYPEYWEYANIMRPSRDDDWMKYMDQTKPFDWDITGIKKARRVLF